MKDRKERSTRTLSLPFPLLLNLGFISYFQQKYLHMSFRVPNKNLHFLILQTLPPKFILFGKKKYCNEFYFIFTALDLKIRPLSFRIRKKKVICN